MLKFPKKPRPKKSHTKKLKDKALRLWSKAIKIPYDGKCALCRGLYRVQSHHIVKRGVKVHSGWFLLDNGVPLCHKCHYLGIHSIHYPTTQIYHKKICDWLKRTKDLDYEVLYISCRQKVDIPLSIVVLEEFIKMNGG